MSDTELRHWQLRRGHYLGEISALCLVNLPPHLSSSPFLIAGTGSQILVYDLVERKVTKSFQVFQGIRVHGISLDRGHEQLADSNICFRIAIFGEKRVKIFTLQIRSDNPRQPFLHMQLDFVHSLPKFGHWVLDVCFLKDSATSSEDTCYLAVGCSDNSLHLWDISRVNMLSEVKCSERCLLYSMRMMGNEIESLLIASGTIFNEIIVWKVVCKKCATIHGDSAKDLAQIDEDFLRHGVKYEDYLISRLIGHEGSIYRIAWFSNGLKLVSVSDDRSARIWEIQAEKGPDGFSHVQNGVSQSGGLVLFGHTARVWDCCIFDSLIITAGEDCTCRVWDHDGRELNVIKEHTGRGVWRCLYDPSSSVLVTAGFDSAIKVRHLYKSHKGLDATMVTEDFSAGKKLMALSIPRSSGHGGLTDSKSEYVRCLHFSREDSLYVATNNGYLYHARLFNNGAVKWTELVRISEEAPIICMDLLSNCSDHSGGFEDWVAVGDGKGTMTVLVVGCASGPNVELAFSWSAEEERHLLGIFWCRSVKSRFIFSTDHGGRLKLWSIYQKMPSLFLSSARSYDACLFAEFVSCFGLRIMCVDASFDEEVLVCGDIRGNLLLFSLPKAELSDHPIAAEINISPMNYFKGAHGVSSVCSVSVAGFCSDQVEIRSTGADGCICYLKHDRHLLNLEFLGLKQVKELSVIRAADQFDDSTFGNYAIGFASANFVIWNLIAETKVMQITCGGWRRPYSYYLGDVPEMENCFSFVKDDTIYVHRQWIPGNCRKIHPRNLHIQFHGREIHSLCFISSLSSWIATGCEDGTVRLTRYEPDTRAWSVSKHLGEHVGGSAVRSIACVSKSFMFIPDGVCENTVTFEDQENIFILISVGAKRVITAWKQTIGMSKKPIDTQCSGSNNIVGNNFTSSFTAATPSLSFQWVSTDMPFKSSTYGKIQNTKEVHATAESLSTMTVGIVSGESLSSKYRKTDLNLEDKHENDWRYLDVSAFLVKDARSRISVCFVVVACSDATVTLRALVIPFQRWFDVALLLPLSSPVLALQHVVIPKLLPSKVSGNMLFGSLYLAICGSTDGSISFWDLTECVENFMLRISGLQTESYMELQKRPRTGRGSQGGRWWRSIYTPNNSKKISCDPVVLRKQTSTGLFSAQPQEPEMQSHVCGASEICLSEQRNSLVSPRIREQDSEQKKDESIPETTILAAAHVLNNVHQSGVNCLHVSDIKDLQFSDSRFSFYVVSGGDDQAINFVRCDLETNSTSQNSENIAAKLDCVALPTSVSNYNNRCRILNHQMKVLCLDKLISAHSSAVKGVWTDGSWVFSTSVDQRVRCWKFDQGRLIEFAHLIINVPEPEAMDVNTCGRNHYQITVAGRGMQMVEFYAENEELIEFGLCRRQTLFPQP